MQSKKRVDPIVKCNYKLLKFSEKPDVDGLVIRKTLTGSQIPTRLNIELGANKVSNRFKIRTACPLTLKIAITKYMFKLLEPKEYFSKKLVHHNQLIDYDADCNPLF